MGIWGMDPPSTEATSTPFSMGIATSRSSRSRFKNSAYHLTDIWTVVDDHDALWHFFSSFQAQEGSISGVRETYRSLCRVNNGAVRWQEIECIRFVKMEKFVGA